MKLTKKQKSVLDRIGPELDVKHNVSMTQYQWSLDSDFVKSAFYAHYSTIKSLEEKGFLSVDWRWRCAVIKRLK